ncbi:MULTISPECIES: HAD family hydrolase [Streptomyces]|uniref:HAD family hydrolase n=1 Tax=Streptomyces TaxID=1883 RepID=UPI0022487A6F|nr:HAD family hydrolase [Streptomyces sp. JHD 1]MCX2967452.1 HAD family hydrolase [Streptomyces sp. JHD 1]
MAIRAVLWDVDDTLFDYTGADEAGVLHHLAEEGVLNRYTSPAAALARWREVMEEQFALFAAGELNYHEHRRGRARGFLGTELTDAEADAWFDRYVARYEAAWCLFPDAVPALDALRADYRHGVLSNAATADQDRKLRRLGIRDRFEVLLCADGIGCAKPAPEAFRAACEALRLEPAEVAYVGDQLATDAQGAQAAGLTGIWLDRLGGPGPDGVPRVTGLAELREALASLVPRPSHPEHLPHPSHPSREVRRV